MLHRDPGAEVHQLVVDPQVGGEVEQIGALDVHAQAHGLLGVVGVQVERAVQDQLAQQAVLAVGEQFLGDVEAVVVIGADHLHVPGDQRVQGLEQGRHVGGLLHGVGQGRTVGGVLVVVELGHSLEADLRGSHEPHVCGGR